jgi:triosephosphate isomerase
MRRNNADSLATQKPHSQRTAEVIISPPALYLLPLAEVVKGSNVKLSAQNCYLKESGAFTGELRYVNDPVLCRAYRGTYWGIAPVLDPVTAVLPT